MELETLRQLKDQTGVGFDKPWFMGKMAALSRPCAGGRSELFESNFDLRWTLT